VCSSVILVLFCKSAASSTLCVDCKSAASNLSIYKEYKVAEDKQLAPPTPTATTPVPRGRQLPSLPPTPVQRSRQLPPLPPAPGATERVSGAVTSITRQCLAGRRWMHPSMTTIQPLQQIWKQMYLQIWCYSQLMTRSCPRRSARWQI
jgi:hypothetical protein